MYLSTSRKEYTVHLSSEQQHTSSSSNTEHEISIIMGQFLYHTLVKSVNFVLKYVTETGPCGRYL